MEIKELKYPDGKLSGLFIPATDMAELKADLKKDSRFLSYVDNFLSKQDKLNLARQEPLTNGLSINEIDNKAAAITMNLYRDAFAKGIPMYYRDSRTKGPKEFVRANPDGSEDLVAFELSTDSYKLLKPLAVSGKGKWAQLLRLGDSSQ